MRHDNLFFLFFVTPVIIAYLVLAWRRPWVARLRFLSIIPYSIFGGFAIHLYSNIREHHRFEDLLASKYVYVSVGINGVIVSALFLVHVPNYSFSVRAS